MTKPTEIRRLAIVNRGEAAMRCILTVKALATGTLPPTLNLDSPDPECALDHVANKARPSKARVAMSNSFGFGGVNASLVFERGES